MSPPTESTKSSKFTAAKQRWLPPLRFSFSWPSAFLKLALTPANCLLIRAFAAPISPGGVSIRSQKSVFASSTVAAVATRISSTRRSNVRACAVTKVRIL
ncbi:Kunitz protease inhibitor [Echinococcus multilocularis]|uniref:Kunitz protease inhibitor n=1 Tax=Echinococcus multilocularis TaxID=6211 RepID=A0A068Y6X8_ECHMU|nr:Kunitz protease inhibitor [Echinococcus multilocularis]